MDKPDSQTQATVMDEKYPNETVQIIQPDNAPPPEYMGSAKDKEDMFMLGRQQVLLVQRYWKSSFSMLQRAYTAYVSGISDSRLYWDLVRSSSVPGSSCLRGHYFHALLEYRSY